MFVCIAHPPLPQNIACAASALGQLQGVILPSSDRGGLRVEFAKANMGEVWVPTNHASLPATPAGAAGMYMM